MTIYRFISPVDVLYLRGNQLFGAGGDHAQALMPPWPSVFAGAIRSRMLVDHGVDLGRLTDKTITLDSEQLSDVLGTPAQPGTFRVSFVALASNGETYHPLPADLSVTVEGKMKSLHRLIPVDIGRNAGVSHSSVLPMLPVMRPPSIKKPDSGFWINGTGLLTYLQGDLPSPDDLIEKGELWGIDSRLGIAGDKVSGTAEKGKIYTTDTVALKRGVGFVVGIDGCDDDLAPSEGLVRLGGDGRGAEISRWTGGVPVMNQRSQDSPFVLSLTTPGIFPDGWLPPGVTEQNGEFRLRADGITARLASAVVPRAEIVSGWDIAAHRPKPAQRAVPAGSTYFFDEVTGDPSAYADGLPDVIETNLGDKYDTLWKQRRAEGFGCTFLGRWPGRKAGE